MATSFRHDLRVLPCRECGAPLEGGAAGGVTTCRYCRSEQRLAPREDATLVVGPRLPEAERLERLRREDAFARPPPPALAGFVVGDRLIPWDVPEALARWQWARRRLAAQPDPAVAEELFALTRVLCSHYEQTGSWLEIRALVEGALDDLDEPRQRQVLRAALARLAAFDADVGAAEAWLEGCDPLAADLESDGAYRLARACIDTARGDFANVLRVLGPSPTEVALPNELDAAAAVLRANAWERMGRLAEASALLVHLAAHGGPVFELRASELTDRYPGLRLCAGSWPAAKQRIAELYAERAAATGPGGLRALTLSGLLVIVGCAAVVAVSAAGDYYGLGFGLHAVTLLVIVFVAMAGAILLVLGYAHVREEKRLLALRTSGRPAAGVVVQRTTTGNATMGVLELSVRVLVFDGGSGYLATTLLFHREPEAPTFARGAAVALRVDPADPHTVALVL